MFIHRIKALIAAIKRERKRRRYLWWEQYLIKAGMPKSAAFYRGLANDLDRDDA